MKNVRAVLHDVRHLRAQADSTSAEAFDALEEEINAYLHFPSDLPPADPDMEPGRLNPAEPAFAICSDLRSIARWENEGGAT